MTEVKQSKIHKNFLPVDVLYSSSIWGRLRISFIFPRSKYHFFIWCQSGVRIKAQLCQL